MVVTRLVVRFAAACLLIHSGVLYAQDPPAQEPVAPATQSQPDVVPLPSPTLPAPPYSRPIDWKTLVPNIADDQLPIWGFPTKVVRGKDWKPTLAFLAVTATLFATDPQTGSYFHNTTAFHGFNNVFSSTNTSAMIAAAPASLLIAGLIRKDHYERNTALLAAEAVADVEILDVAMKYGTKRLRPNEFNHTGNYNDSWWEGGTGFPSGHTISAFAVATVISRRYPHQRWLPFVSYGLATAIGFSRMTTSAHFAGDVFVGSVLGYAISRFVVLRQ
jgi:membrane-associated phospholipid phosphatase